MTAVRRCCQHVDDVLGSWLGMDAKELAALRQDGIV